MNTTTLSPKFQIVIPTKIRQTLALHKGIKFQVIPYNERIELIPIQPISKARGFLRGIDTSIKRESDRNL